MSAPLPESHKPGAKLETCPICKKVSVARFRPFCSERCADLDLGRWLKGSYAVPTDEPPDTEDPPGQLPHGV